MKLSPILLSGALACAIGLPVAGMAQQAPMTAPASTAPFAGHRHHGMKRIFRGVSLSDQQRAQIKSAMTQFHQAHPKGSAPDRAARKALHQQIMSILTPAQQAQVKANMARMRARHHRNANAVFAPSPTASPA